MKNFGLLAFSVVMLGLLAGPTAASRNSRLNRERHPDLKRALHALQTSRADLMKGDRDFGGHRTKAVQAIDNAIDEIHQAIQFEHS